MCKKEGLTPLAGRNAGWESFLFAYYVFKTDYLSSK